MLPVQRTSRSQGKMRRSHDRLKAAHAVTCPNCGAAKRPHVACPECGYVRPGLSLKTKQED